ncbi:MAG: oligopeptide transporter, OPT family, partial [Gemmatimonadaceae bacterium]
MSAPPIPAQPAISPTADRVELAGDDVTITPYVPDSQELPELTAGAIALGIGLGLIFAASSVFLALKVGLTVSASIPIAVLSITIFRWISRVFGKQPATILQNNMVQTTGSAGESIAAGITFTLPALLLLGYALPASKVAAIALVGGLLGVFLMVPLRRTLIVKEHKNLKYPEGTACAEVLIVGEKRGTQAKMVFAGFGIGALYKLLNAGTHLFPEIVVKTFQRALPAGGNELFGEIRSEISPELTGVGYIIGPRIAGYLFAGGCLSFFVLIPAIKFFGGGLTTVIAPATTLISGMDAMAIRANYVYYIGAGAVTAAGLISLLRTLPTIVRAIAGGIGDVRSAVAGGSGVRRTQRDLPIGLVLGMVVILAIAMIVLPQIGINLLGAVLAVFFAFLFVTVSSRITGAIGASSNPISGMTVATVLLTSLIFLAVGWTGIEHRVLALSIGGVVCVAAAVAGATSQDLKTGYLVGATPRRQQIGLIFGVVSSALLVGYTIQGLNRAYETIVVKNYPSVRVPAAQIDGTRDVDGTAYRVGHLFEQTGPAPAGEYLLDQSGAIKYVVDPGIGGREATDFRGRTVTKLDSPKAQIMRLVVDGILTQKLSWGLILIGAFLAISLEILGLPSLPIAVGVYLPISTSATMFIGGAIRWLAEKRSPPRSEAEADSGPGVLLSSGLIAGGAIMNVLVAALGTIFLAGHRRTWADAIDVGHLVGGFGTSALVGVVFYAVL